MSRSMRQDLDAAMVGVVLDEHRRAAILEAMKKGEKPMRKVIRPMVVLAAVIAALTISALAFSPAVQEMLAEALGKAAHYAQTVEGVSAVDNGIEVSVVSAITDSSTTEVYLAVRDLKGDRLADETLSISCYLSRPDTEVGIGVLGGSYLSYDPESRTALFVVYREGGAAKTETSAIEVHVSQVADIKGEWVIKTELEQLPQRRFTMNETINGLTEHTLMLSPLSVVMTGDKPDGAGGSLQASALFAVWMKDGTVLFPKNNGSMWSNQAEGDRAIDRWEFAEPVDVEQIVGISVWYWYIPVDRDTAGPGYWLDKLPE